jgi:hypothetical protein
MARIQAYRANYCSAGATLVVAAGPGAIHTIVCTSSSTTPAAVTFWDQTSAGSPALFTFYVNANAPVIFNFKDIGPMRFTNGLTIVTPASATCFVVTEQ